MVDFCFAVAVAKTYGKVFHFWQFDKGDTLPIGPPQLMMAITTDGQLRLAASEWVPPAPHPLIDLLLLLNSYIPFQTTWVVLQLGANSVKAWIPNCGILRFWDFVSLFLTSTLKKVLSCIFFVFFEFSFSYCVSVTKIYTNLCIRHRVHTSIQWKSKNL